MRVSTSLTNETNQDMYKNIGNMIILMSSVHPPKASEENI